MSPRTPSLTGAFRLTIGGVPSLATMEEGDAKKKKLIGRFRSRNSEFEWARPSKETTPIDYHKSEALSCTYRRVYFLH